MSKSKKAKSRKEEANPQACNAAQRQLSPTCLNLLPQSSVERLLSAEACCYLLTNIAKHYEGLVKLVPSREAKPTLRSLDFTAKEMIQLLPLKAFRALGDKVCDNLASIATAHESSSDWSSQRAVLAFDAFVRILAVSIRLVLKDHPSLLQILRGLATNEEEAAHLKRTSTKLEVALLKDD